MQEKLLLDDTIAAISTPVGRSGIGIVRLSGKDALSIADKIFSSADGRRPSEFPSHSLHYGWIENSLRLTAQSAKQKKSLAEKPERIDEVLLTVMRAPRTYTRQDIVEINCHSGIVVLKRILELVLKLGARLALPGEFTRRAYLSGRIDLAQAEAVLDVVNSQTKEALSQALGQLEGKFSRRINALRKQLLDILTLLEASIDFADQDIELTPAGELGQRMDRVNRDLTELLDTAERGMTLRAGFTCVICGRPNVGKSSLLNALLRRDRAIVTPVPGTTRDVLEETIDLQGIPLHLIDTAGIIRGRSLAEKEAVRRSRQYLKEASLILLVLDASRRLSPADFQIARFIAHKPAFIVLNKQDLPVKVHPQEASRVLPGRPLVSVSALEGTGLQRLEREMASSIWQGKTRPETEIMVTNLRHKQALIRAQKFLQQAISAVKSGCSAEIVAEEVKAAQEALGEIIGQIHHEDILEQIFSQFCIGK